MELLTKQSSIVETKTEFGIVFSVSGTDDTHAAIQAMVPTHAKELAKNTDWNVSAKVTAKGADIRIGGRSESDQTKIQAPGFFGIMAIGVHHQAHHLAMATGLAHGD